MNNSIYLHIGTYNTGTSTIQHFLANNLDKLASNNIFIPKCLNNKKLSAHHEFAVWADELKSDFSVTSIWNTITAVKKHDFDKDIHDYYKQMLQVSRQKNQSILISTEYIFDFNKDSLIKIKNFFDQDPREIKIIIYLRRVDLLMIDAYYHKILIGVQKKELPVFNKYDPLLQFKKKILLISEIFGEENIIIRPYDKSRFLNGNLIDDFLSIFGIENKDFKMIPDEDVGISSLGSKVLLECAEYINPFIIKDGKEIHNPDWNILVNKIQRLNLKSRKDMLVSRGDALALYDQFKDDYKWIISTYLKGYPYGNLFNEAFEMYDENYHPLNLTFEHGAEVMLALWKMDFPYSENSKIDLSFENNSQQCHKHMQSISYTPEELIIAESEFFDKDWYIEIYPDVKRANVDAVKHYCSYGWKENRNPSERFNTQFYLENNQDIQKANINPLLHYLNYGKDERRLPVSENQNNENNNKYIDILKKSYLFNENWYYYLYPDVEAAAINAADHFFYYGFSEGRIPSPDFNMSDYIRHYPEVKNSSLNPLIYYLLIGKRKGHNVFNNHGSLEDIMPALNHQLVMNKKITLDIVVQSTNENDESLFETIKIVMKKTICPYNIYVLVNHSIKNKLLMDIQQFDKNIKVIKLQKKEDLFYTIGKISKYENYIVFIQSGVFVPENWVNRILYPILEDDKVLSVQPIVHKDPIASFIASTLDDFNLFDLDVDSIDRCFSAFSGFSIDTPVWESSLVAINSHLLNKILIKNSLVCSDLTTLLNKSKKFGFRNKIAPGLFVRNSNSVVVQEDREIKDFIANNRMVQFHIFALLKLGSEELNKGVSVFFDSINDRSVIKYSSEIILTKRRLQPVCVIKYNPFSLRYDFNAFVNDMDIKIELDTLNDFWEICEHLPIQEICINDLKSFPLQLDILEKIIMLKENKRLIINVNMHDYNIICPQYTLLDFKEIQCVQRDNKKRCNKCISNSQIFVGKKSVDIDSWRLTWGKILQLSEKIRVFSSFSQSLIKQIYEQINDSQLISAFPDIVPLRASKIRKGNELHIGIIGKIDQKNGSRVVLALNNYMKRNKIGKLTIIGTFNDAVKPDFTVTGRFYQDRLPEMIEKNGINVCFVPTTWRNPLPYVFEEIKQMDIPFVAFDFLQDDKIKNCQKCCFVPYGSHVSHIINELLNQWNSLPVELPPSSLIKTSSPKDYYEKKIIYNPEDIKNNVKLIAYHLPQFYSFPENDEWWGKGFTEWTNVTKAKPLFHGHYQPRVPHEDIGYYRLDKIDHIRKQAELLNNYGLYGLCFYHYWFGGKRLMEKPVDLLLNNKDINLNFCLCWANEGWTRSWDGDEKNVLIGQNYSPENDIKFIEDLSSYLEDVRYIKVDGKPLIHVYRIDHMPFPKRTTEVWRKWCIENGIGEIYLIGIAVRGIKNPENYGFDALVNRPYFDWNIGQMIDYKEKKKVIIDHYRGVIQKYSEVADFYINQTETQDNGRKLRTVGVMWDPSARHGDRCLIVDQSNPNDYQRWLEKEIDYTTNNIPKAEQFIFLNAWNEWAEGAYLEPDSKFGYSFLNATARALRGKNKQCVIPQSFLFQES